MRLEPQAPHILGYALVAFGAAVAAFFWFIMGNVPLTALGIGMAVVGSSLAITPLSPVPSATVRRLLEGSLLNIEALLEELGASGSGKGYYVPRRDGSVQVFIPMTADGQDKLVHEWVYNEDNLPVESKDKWSYISYTWDSDHRLLSYDMYFDLGMASSNWETAQQSMNRTEWVTPENTEINGRANYFYTKNKLSKIEVTRLPGGVKSSTTYEYDDKGRISKRIYYYENKQSGFIEFHYDAYVTRLLFDLRVTRLDFSDRILQTPLHQF